MTACREVAETVDAIERETLADDLIDGAADLSSIDDCVRVLYERGHTARRIGPAIVDAMIEARTRID